MGGAAKIVNSLMGLFPGKSLSSGTAFSATTVIKCNKENRLQLPFPPIPSNVTFPGERVSGVKKLHATDCILDIVNNNQVLLINNPDT